MAQTMARPATVAELLERARVLETWSEPHDCDDIPCPTYGDDCPWNAAQDLRFEADDLAAGL